MLGMLDMISTHGLEASFCLRMSPLQHGFRKKIPEGLYNYIYNIYIYISLSLSVFSIIMDLGQLRPPRP